MNAEQRVIVTPTFWGKFLEKLKVLNFNKTKLS